jgi:hypothetical protein
MREGFMHEMSKDEQLKADRGGGRVIVGEWSGALIPCAFSSRMLASSSKEKADTGRLGLCRRRGSMGGSQGGEADEKYGLKLTISASPFSSASGLRQDDERVFLVDDQKAGGLGCRLVVRERLPGRDRPGFPRLQGCRQ